MAADREAEASEADRAEADLAEDRGVADPEDLLVADRGDPTGISEVRGWGGDQDRPTEDRPADPTMADASRGDAAVACRLSESWHLPSSAQSCSRSCYKKTAHCFGSVRLFCGKGLTSGEKCGTIRATNTGGQKNMKNKVEKGLKKMKQKGDGFFADFKKFITKGNVLDLAVAVVMATAFNAIVTGLVKYIITPLITYATSGVSIDEWEWVIREASTDAAGTEIPKISVQYGLFLQAILDFLIIAFCIFLALRIIRNAERTLNAKKIAEAEAEAAKKKAEEDEKAAEAKAAEEAKAAIEAEFYANVREQSALLREIRDAMGKR